MFNIFKQLINILIAFLKYRLYNCQIFKQLINNLKVRIGKTTFFKTNNERWLFLTAAAKASFMDAIPRSKSEKKKKESWGRGWFTRCSYCVELKTLIKIMYRTTCFQRTPNDIYKGLKILLLQRLFDDRHVINHVFQKGFGDLSSENLPNLVPGWP